jgi:hypothetical protein
MYQTTFKELYRQDYLKKVEDFINFILYNLKNISKSEIKYPSVKYNNKKFHNKDIMIMLLLKKRLFYKYLC